jgi:MFS family permease
MEVPGLVCAGWLARRIGLRWLLLLSVVPFALFVALWGDLPSPAAIIVTRLLTGFFYGTLMAARVLAVARLLPASIQATGQSLAQAATVGLGSVLGALIGGAIYEALGAEAFFATSAVLTCAGGVGVWFAPRGPPGGRERGGAAVASVISASVAVEVPVAA